MSDTSETNEEESTETEDPISIFHIIKKYFKKLLFYIFIFQVLSVLAGKLLPVLLPPPLPQTEPSDIVDSSSLNTPHFHAPVFLPTDKLLFTFYVSFNEDFYVQKKIVYQGIIRASDENLDMNFTFNISDISHIKGNSSMYLHIQVTSKRNMLISGKKFTFIDTNKVLNKTERINNVYRDVDVRKKSLLRDGESSVNVTYNTYWPEVVYLNYVYFGQRIPRMKQIVYLFDLDKHLNYFPVVYYNRFWQIKENMKKVNESTEVLSIKVNIYSVTFWKYQLYSQLESTFKMQAEMGLMNSADNEDLKRMLIGNPPWLLALTFVVTMLHSVFDFLAFKNDVSFWKNKKNLHGISLKTLLWNSASSVIIFLYLLNNDTSWTILISNGLGLLIEFWKIFKAFKIQVKLTSKFPYVLEVSNKKSYVENKTKEYDDKAMTYLFYALIPLLLLYSIYNLIYNEHKGWYSYILQTLVGFIYAFGFIMMCPQLFINYKLKSVAHLNLRTMTYKVLNTFIDDLFAVVVKMPLLHKIATLRDDVVFFVYLYQRWIYRVDKTRFNEYGQRLKQDKENTEKEKTD